MSDKNQTTKPDSERPSARAKPRLDVGTTIILERQSDRGPIYFVFCEGERRGLKHIGHAAFTSDLALEWAQTCNRQMSPQVDYKEPLREA